MVKGTHIPRLLIILNPSFGQHGVLTKDLPLILKHLNPQENQVRVIAGTASTGSLKRAGFVVDEIPLKTPNEKKSTILIGYLIYLLMLFFRLLKSISEFSPHFLFSISGHAYTGLITTIAGKITRIRTIIRISEPTSTSVGIKYFGGSILAAVIRIEELWVLKNCDIPISNRKMTRYYPPDISNRIKVVSQGVDTSIFRSRLGQWQPDKSSILLLSIARLSAEKNLDLLIHAVRICKRSYPGLSANIIGVGPIEKQLKNLVESLELSKDIKFLGYIGNATNVSRLISSSDIFVLPSRVEGLPSAMLEAMACKIPVVTAGSWGVSSTDFVDGIHLYVCDANPSAIAESVIGLIENTTKTREIIENAYKLVIEKHTINSCRTLFRKLILLNYND
jgi:glycosyltransferase involved in cell wall biosynthesis